MKYYAHSRKGEDKSKWQTLKDHLTNTAVLAERFGVDAGISELARTAALMHDLGKYSKAFQARLDGSPRKVDHATAGARTAIELFNKTDIEKWLATMLAFCIAGHHTGLPDYGSAIDVDGDGTLLARLDPAKKKLEDYSAYKTEIDPATLAVQSRSIKTSNQSFSLAFMTRMLYSALVDADFQETETFMQQGEKPRGGYASIEKLFDQFRVWNLAKILDLHPFVEIEQCLRVGNQVGECHARQTLIQRGLCRRTKDRARSVVLNQFFHCQHAGI